MQMHLLCLSLMYPFPLGRMRTSALKRLQTPSSSVARKKERLRRRLQKREKKGLTVEVGDAYIRKIGDEEV
mgnify:CR=1 FL=1